MGHTDVVNVDPKKWRFPPFGAQRDGGYVYGRGTVDDKDNVVACLMAMLVLKRSKVPLDRDAASACRRTTAGRLSQIVARMIAVQILPAICQEESDEH
ncbi:MAG: M20/M25/M40 family metallo-hydrolase [Rhodospirillaceae bacterium]|nr:M20/M25/M40 family metallo-hydrolase [Rhodospirillaceae bacterium]